MATPTQEPAYSYQELLYVHLNLIDERDGLLLKLAKERLRNSDLQKTVNLLQEQTEIISNG